MALRRQDNLSYHRGPHEKTNLYFNFDLDLLRAGCRLRQLPGGCRRGWMDDVFRDVL